MSDRDDDDDDRPRMARRPRRDDDEDDIERPRPRRRRDDDYDDEDDVERPRNRGRRRPRDIGDDPGMRMLLPVGQSGWAIAAGYLGLFSVLVIFAPLAIIAGILALREIAWNPRKHGKGRAWFGIVAGSAVLLGIVALIAIGALANKR